MIIELNKLVYKDSKVNSTLNVLINTDKVIRIDHYIYDMPENVARRGSKIQLTAAMVTTIYAKESVEDIKKLIFGTKL